MKLYFLPLLGIHASQEDCYPSVAPFANHRIIWPPSGAILLRNFNGLCVVVLELFSVVVVNF